MPIDASEAAQLVSSPMSKQDTQQVLSLLMAGSLETEKGAQLLTTWAKRGETGLELASAVDFLKQHAVAVPLERASFDLCGTGGSGLSRFNVSTTVAFVLAAAGVPVAKHGNRGSARPNGSFDLLDALEVPFDMPPAQLVELQQQTGLCFLFARTHHPAVGKVVPYRKAAGCRTIFNLAGPLANPAPLSHQLIGTTNERSALVLAQALQELGENAALVVWGHPGIDEISVTGPTQLLSVNRAHVTKICWDAPAHPGLDYAQLPHGNAVDNAAVFLSILAGSEKGPLLDMICENAGAALDLWAGRPPQTAGEGARQARALIEAGQVQKAFVAHREAAQRLSSLA